jgi:hypothetical protein
MRLYLHLGVEEAEHKIPAWEYHMLLDQLVDDRPWITYAVQVEHPDSGGGDGETDDVSMAAINALAAAQRR